MLLGPVLGGAATVVGLEPVFSAVAAVGVVLAAWALSLPAPVPAAAPRFRQVAATLVSAPVLAGAWLVALPAMLAGTLNVLAPLRLDELGASGVAIGAIFLVSAGIEAVLSRLFGSISDRRGRMAPIRIGLIAAAGAALVLPLPATVVLLAAAVLAAILAMALLWVPAMALLSDAAEAGGLDLAFAACLVNLAWAGGQVIGGSGGAGLAEATSDAVPYAILAALFVLTAMTLLAAQGRPADVRSNPR